MINLILHIFKMNNNKNNYLPNIMFNYHFFRFFKDTENIELLEMLPRTVV